MPCTMSVVVDLGKEKGEEQSLSSIFGVIHQSFNLLERADRWKALIVVAIHIVLGVLDVVAVFLIGLVGSLAVTGISAKVPGTRTLEFLQLINIEEKPLQFQVATLGLLASSVLVLRSVSSLYLTKKALFFLANRSALISKRMIYRFFSQELLSVRRRTTHESIYALTQGVQNIANNVLAASLVLVADLFLIIALSTSLFIVDKSIALASLIFFVGTGVLLYYRIHKRVQELGEITTSLSMASNRLIDSVILNYREIFVKDRKLFYSQKISSIRQEIFQSGAELSFMALINKYLMEIALVLGGLIVGALQFTMQPASRAVANISIFLVTSVRITPAILRVQTSFLNIRNGMGLAFPTLKLMSELESDHVNQLDESSPLSFGEVIQNREDFKGNVSLKRVTFAYPGLDSIGLFDINLEIPSGQFVGIVGPSGAGKTTLVDLLLGLMRPSKGEILISGLSPKSAISKWPGAISYLAQDISIIFGTLKENICLGFDSLQVDDVLIQNLIYKVGLEELLNLPQGIHSQLGDRGYNLSGGQRQRIGIARSLLTNPKLLILDEATSALDASNEAFITSQLESLRGELTLIMIAHRLSTIREADVIYYLDAGRLQGYGTFEELRRNIPNFDSQAKSMGL